MRPLLKYGVPAAAGLATGGYALSQGEDPGTAALAGVGGILGGAAGLKGARLAGKYMSPYLGEALGKGGLPISDAVLKELGKGAKGGLRQKMATDLEGRLTGLYGNPNAGAVIAGATQGTPFERNIQKGIAAVALPTSAALAGLGGVAAGGGLQAMGVPGFQQSQYMDPEAYGSSNSNGVRTPVTTISYPHSSYA